MTEVKLSKRYPAAGSEMWERIGDPGRLAAWHPAIERTEVSDGGRRRVNTVVGGARVSETILEEADRHHVFRIDDGPLPYDAFISTIRVRDDGEDTCLVEWDATLEASPGSEQEAVELTRGFFQAGLDALSTVATRTP